MTCPEYQQLRRQQPDFLRFCYTPELALEATLQPLRRFQPDAAILFSDILVVADALGRNVRFVESHGPVLDPLNCEDDLRALSAERIEEHLAPVYATVGDIAAALPATTELIGFAGRRGRWRSTWWKDAEEPMAPRRGHGPMPIPELRPADRGAGGGNRPPSFGADRLRCRGGAQLFDSWAGLLSSAADGFRRWVIAPTAGIVRRLRQQHPRVPVIGFPLWRRSALRRVCGGHRRRCGGAGCPPCRSMLQFATTLRRAGQS